MRIEEDQKLDYSDVLIRPKRSTLGSRKEVDLERGFTFRNTASPKHENNRHYRGVPLMASNMDGVGTFEMADELASQKIMTCLVKTYSVEHLAAYFGTDSKERRDYVAMSIGITDKDADKFSQVYEQASKGLKYVCIDVANG
jgi:GMP reductase